MHSEPVNESDGKLSRPLLCQGNCPKCGNHHGNTYQTWEASDGGHEDFKYTCWKCGYVWWIDGIDS